MKNFILIVDEKVSVWKRSTVKISADSIDEAVKYLTEHGVTSSEEILDTDYIFETEEPINSDLVGNKITVEVMDLEYNTLGTDADK